RAGTAGRCWPNRSTSTPGSCWIRCRCPIRCSSASSRREQRTAPAKNSCCPLRLTPAGRETASPGAVVAGLLLAGPLPTRAAPGTGLLALRRFRRFRVLQLLGQRSGELRWIARPPVVVLRVHQSVPQLCVDRCCVHCYPPC